MPTFKVWMADGRVASIPAPDSASALRAAEHWAQENPVPMSADGMARAFGSGVINGTVSLGNLMHPGGDPDYVDLAQRGGQWLAQHLGIQPAAQAQAGFDRAALARRAMLGPTSTEAQQAVHLYHEPVNEPERLADTLGAFLPNAFFGGGGWGARAARVAVPTVTTEGARYGAEKAGAGPIGQTLASLVGNAAGNAFVRPRVASSMLPTSPAAKGAVAANIPLTWGQQMGGMAKTLEDHMIPFPILGSAIQGARKRGVEAFNRALANAALAPLNKTLPANVPVGPAMVRHLEEAVSQAEASVGQNVGQIKPTPYLHRMLEDRLTDYEVLDPKRLAEVRSAVNAHIISPIQNGEVDGNNILEFHNNIDNLALTHSYGGPEHIQIGDALTKIGHDMYDYIDNQYPGYADAKRRLDFARDMTQNIGIAQDFDEAAGPLPIEPMRLMDSMAGRYTPRYVFVPTRARAFADQLANHAYDAFGKDPKPDPTGGRLLSGGGLLALGMSPATAIKPWAALGLASLPYQLTGRDAPRWFANVKPEFDPNPSGPAPLPENAVRFAPPKPSVTETPDPAKAPGPFDSNVVRFPL